MIRKFLGNDFISPDEIGMLQRVFDAVCTEEDKTSAEADLDALTVFRLFRAGFKDEVSLLAELRRWKARIRHLAPQGRQP